MVSEVTAYGLLTKKLIDKNVPVKMKFHSNRNIFVYSIYLENKGQLIIISKLYSLLFINCPLFLFDFYFFKCASASLINSTALSLSGSYSKDFFIASIHNSYCLSRKYISPRLSQAFAD